jgi:hypothetical protein
VRFEINMFGRDFYYIFFMDMYTDSCISQPVLNVDT